MWKLTLIQILLTLINRRRGVLTITDPWSGDFFWELALTRIPDPNRSTGISCVHVNARLHCRLADGGDGRETVIHHVKRRGIVQEGERPGDMMSGGNVLIQRYRRPFTGRFHGDKSSTSIELSLFDSDFHEMWSRFLTAFASVCRRFSLALLYVSQKNRIATIRRDNVEV